MKKIDKKIVISLFGIIIVAIILRFWNLDSVPPSLNWDEVSWGYNSFSILNTGRDEFGELLPYVLRSFNDFKPALYAYLSIPFIWQFGLTDFAVRFTSALFGVFSVILTYFLAKELFKRKDIAILSSFLMAISPWSIQFSRFAHESQVSLTFNILVALFFIKGLKKPLYLSVSALFAAISMYSYQGEKVFIPLFVLILVISFHKQIFEISKKYLTLAFLIGFIISLPLVMFTFSNPEAFNRARGASFLNKPGGVLSDNHFARVARNYKERNIVGQVIDNRRIIYGKQILGNYLSNYDPNFLFIKGDNIPRHHPPNMGHLYLIELPFLLLGLYFLFFGLFSKQTKIFLGLWLLIVPISSSITWDVPHAGRTIKFLPLFQMIIALGLVYFFDFLKKLNIRKIFTYIIFLIISILFLINFFYFLNQYFVQYRINDSQAWQYGYGQIIPEVQKQYDNYEYIYVSTKGPLEQSYIFFLYNLKYPPGEYQRENRNKNFDKYKFGEFNFDNREKGNLYIGSENEFSGNYENDILKRIYFLDGTSGVIIVKG